MQQTSDSRYRLRARTFTCMGTVISVTVPSDTQKAPGAAEDELEAATAVVERLISELDGTFSLYRPDSEASRLAGFPLGGYQPDAAAPGASVSSVLASDGGGKAALATSGSAERGDHIWSVAAAAPEFRQVSVAAADVVTADVLATAIVAGGTPMLHRATVLWDIEVLAVRRGGELLATPGFRR